MSTMPPRSSVPWYFIYGWGGLSLQPQPLSEACSEGSEATLSSAWWLAELMTSGAYYVWLLSWLSRGCRLVGMRGWLLSW